MLDDLIQDKCGVFGIWGDKNASERTFVGLHLLQHRGQEHCGIVSATKKKFYKKHCEGIVNEAFSNEDLRNLRGRAAIGHVKYTTQGSSSMVNAQPFLRHTKHGNIALAHNGEFANQNSLREMFEKEGHVFTTTSDTELPIHFYGLTDGNTIEEKMRDTFELLKPAYAIVMLTRNELMGIRDVSGVRPLVIGELSNGATIFASETVAFDAIGAKYIGEVEPGELVIVNDGGIRRVQLLERKERLSCVFEHIYFGRPDSFQFGSDVTNSVLRKELGAQLYREHPIEADVVTPMPDSSNDAALGFSEESYKNGKGTPFGFGIVRSHYIGRTFIEPTQALRDIGVTKKFNVNKSEVQGKSVVVVDDSIIRATTLKKLVKKIKHFGAKEVHVRVTSPPYKHACYLGINTPEKKRLIAHREGSVDGVRKFIGADSLGYLSKEGMLSNKYFKGMSYCTHCFDGVRKIRRS
jgi:amidophosphoribosyltransferase